MRAVTPLSKRACSGCRESISWNWNPQEGGELSDWRLELRKIKRRIKRSTSPSIAPDGTERDSVLSDVRRKRRVPPIAVRNILVQSHLHGGKHTPVFFYVYVLVLENKHTTPKTPSALALTRAPQRASSSASAGPST